MSRLSFLALLPMMACIPDIDADLVRVDIDGRERSAYVHTPSDAGTDAPVLLAFHGAALGGAYRGAWFAQDTDFIAQADRDGFVVVFPNGLDGKWSDSQDEGPDDQAFIDKLLTQLADEADTTNVVAAGHSNGGFFSMRLGCERPDLVKGVASVSGGELSSVPCADEGPVSVLLAAGTEDSIVPFEGGKVLFGLGPSARAHNDVVNDTVARLTCPEIAPTVVNQDGEDGSKAEIRTYGGCEADTEVVAVKILGGNHVWPGQANPDALTDSKQAWDATAGIADFAARAWLRTSP